MIMAEGDKLSNTNSGDMNYSSQNITYFKIEHADFDGNFIFKTLELQ